MVYKYTKQQAEDYAAGRGGPSTSELHTEREAEKADARAEDYREAEQVLSPSEQRVSDWRRDNPDRWVASESDQSVFVGVGDLAGRGLQFDNEGDSTPIVFISQEQAALLPQKVEQQITMGPLPSDSFYTSEYSPAGGAQTFRPPTIDGKYNEYGMPTFSVEPTFGKGGLDGVYDIFAHDAETVRMGDKINDVVYLVNEKINEFKDSDALKRGEELRQRAIEFDKKFGKINPIPTQKEVIVGADVMFAPHMPNISKKSWIAGADLIMNMPTLPVYLGKKISHLERSGEITPISGTYRPPSRGGAEYGVDPFYGEKFSNVKLFSGKPTTELAGHTGSYLSMGYEEFKFKPATGAVKIATEIALMYAGGWAIGAASKVGVIGVRSGVGKVGKALATKYTRYEDVPISKLQKGLHVGWGDPTQSVEKFVVSLPQSIVAAKKALGKYDLLKSYSPKINVGGKMVLDPTRFKLGKLREQAFTLPEKFVEPAVGLGFMTAVGYDVVSTPGEEVPEKMAHLAVGFLGAMRGYRAPERMIDRWRVRGRKEIPDVEMIQPEILSGKEQFSNVKKGETIEQLIKRFEDPHPSLKLELGDTAMSIHASPYAFKAEFPVQYGATRLSDMPGLYGAPARAISPHFSRTGQLSKPKGIDPYTGKEINPDAVKLGFWQKLVQAEPESLTPQLVATSLKGVGRIPGRSRSSLTKSREYIGELEGGPYTPIQGKGVITRNVELAVKGGSKVEAELTTPPDMWMSRTSQDFYIRVGDRKVPIDTYKTFEGDVRPGPTKAEIFEVTGTVMPKYGSYKARRENILQSAQKARKAELAEMKGESGRGGYSLPKTTSKGRYLSSRTQAVKSYIPVPSSYKPITESYTTRIKDSYVPPESYVPKLGDSYSKVVDSSNVKVPDSYVPVPSSSKVVVDKSYVRPPPSKVPPPPEIIIPSLKLKLKKQKTTKKYKKYDTYKWDQENPIATLEEMMTGKKSKRKKS